MISNTEKTITIRMNGDGYDVPNFPIPVHIVEKSCACCWDRCDRKIRKYEMGMCISGLFRKNIAEKLAHNPEKIAVYLNLTYSKVLPGDTAKKYAKDWGMLIHMVALHGIECVLDEDGNKVFPQIHPGGSGGGYNDSVTDNAADPQGDYADDQNCSGTGGGK